MSRRWSLYGITNAVTVFMIGQILALIIFPINFQTVFILLSFGSLISYYFSLHISIPEQSTNLPVSSESTRSLIHDYYMLIRSYPNFGSFVFKRFVFSAGTAMTLPLLPLYFVRVIEASDVSIAVINTAATATLVIGYFYWIRVSRRKSSNFILLWSTLGLSLYPMLVSFLHQEWLIALLAGISGIFQAGTSLTFFEEFMKTVPEEYGATFVSVGQSVEHLALILAPIFASSLSLWIGVGPALFISGLVRLSGFFAFPRWQTSQDEDRWSQLILCDSISCLYGANMTGKTSYPILEFDGSRNAIIEPQPQFKLDTIHYRMRTLFFPGSTW